MYRIFFGILEKKLVLLMIPSNEGIRSLCQGYTFILLSTVGKFVLGREVYIKC